MVADDTDNPNGLKAARKETKQSSEYPRAIREDLSIERGVDEVGLSGEDEFSLDEVSEKVDTALLHWMVSPLDVGR